MKDEGFADTINDSGAIRPPDRELPGQYPTTAQDVASAEKLNVKYGRFVVGKTGNPDLEAIMDDCVNGKKLLAQEKWYFTKEGDSLVVIKYYVRADAPAPKDPLNIIQGRRRLKKAMRGE